MGGQNGKNVLRRCEYRIETYVSGGGKNQLSLVCLVEMPSKRHKLSTSNKLDARRKRVNRSESEAKARTIKAKPYYRRRLGVSQLFTPNSVKLNAGEINEESM